MGEPVTGRWASIRARSNADPYSGTATRWGTGINPVHQFYGSPPLRTYGRNQQIPDVHAPAEATPGFIETHEPWGYNPADIRGLDVFADDEAAITGVQFVQDDWPEYGEDTTTTRAAIPSESSRPWGSSGGYKNILRSIRSGPGPANFVFKKSYELPTETVSEGWLNKAASGMQEGEIPDSVPADDSQVMVQTSKVQRYRELSNVRAVARDTDEERTPIGSRIAPMKLKVYSEGQRHYDMFPYQIDQMPKPFWYRSAATGRIIEMEPNEQYEIVPIQRTVPPDPGLGPEDTSLSLGDYGYTPEDVGYY